MSHSLLERTWRPLNRTVRTSMLAAAVAAAAWPAAAEELTWIRQPAGCGAPDSTGTVFTSFTCGDLGRFTFSNDPDLAIQPLSACSPSHGGQEVPESYDTTTPLPPTSSGQSPDPCQGAICHLDFVPSSGEWVAVVDWDDWHGRSVSWMIQSLSGIQPVLFDLGAGEPAGATSDVHLLRALCGVVDHIDRPGARPPAALNMSFGRPRAPFERPVCDNPHLDPALSCMVSEALAEIRLGTPIFAAAGNHDTLLFPASDEAVEAVGGLDLPWFRLSHEVAASWRTPDAVKSLMPASSLCIDDQNGNPWAAPPGTSWASAILSAWVASAQVPPAHASTSYWRPRVTSKDDYLLTHQFGDVPASSSASFRTLFDQLRHQGAYTPCAATAHLVEDDVTVVAERATAGLDATPLVFLERSAHGPTPTPDPCMPCTGGWDDEPGGGGLFGLEERALSINITESDGVPQDLTLVGLGLMVNRGAQLFTLTPTGISLRVFLEQVSRAQIDQLFVTDLSDHVYDGDELNLYFSNPYAADTDGDGLDDRAEVL
ncbi:MAG: S8/S53 family peptidase, partial [Acidobacteriota bacterium]